MLLSRRWLNYNEQRANYFDDEAFADPLAYDCPRSRLIGDPAFGFSEQTNDLTGVSGFGFAGLAALVGVGFISGSSAPTFAPSGSVAGRGMVAGLSSIAFAASGAAVEAATMSGSSALTFSGVGLVSGRGLISGASVLAFSPAAAAIGRGSVGGASGFSIAGSGVLIGKGQLSGPTGLTFASAGSLTVPDVGLSGSASSVFTASGLLISAVASGVFVPDSVPAIVSSVNDQVPGYGPVTNDPVPPVVSMIVPSDLITVSILRDAAAPAVSVGDFEALDFEATDFDVGGGFVRDVTPASVSVTPD